MCFLYRNLKSAINCIPRWKMKLQVTKLQVGSVKNNHARSTLVVSGKLGVGYLESL